MLRSSGTGLLGLFADVGHWQRKEIDEFRDSILLEVDEFRDSICPKFTIVSALEPFSLLVFTKSDGSIAKILGSDPRIVQGAVPFPAHQVLWAASAVLSVTDNSFDLILFRCWFVSLCLR